MSQNDPTGNDMLKEVVSLQSQFKHERNVIVRILRLASSDNDLHSLMREATLLVREWSGCEAVGIRLRDGDDFPYFETRGFPPEFVQTENTLCVRDMNGRLARDSQGNVVMECMCGNILCGRFNPAMPSFTPNGSFWTNSTTEFLTNTMKTDRHARTPNRCNMVGFESVALIPLRSSGTTFGLLQMNDRSTGRFTIEKITLIEGLAAALGEAIFRRKATQELRLSRQALRESEQRFRDLAGLLPQMVYEINIDGRVTFLNQRALEMFGYNEAEFEAGLNIFQMMVSHERDRVRHEIRSVLDGRDLDGLAHTAQRKDGTQFPVLVHSSRILRHDTPVGLRGIVIDITDYKRVKQTLSSSEVRYRRLFESAKDGILILNAETGTILDVNPFLVDLLGYSHEQFLGKRIWELDFFKDVAASQAAFTELQRREYVRYENLLLESSNGRQINVEFISNVYLVDQQKVIQCNIRDITERKRSEEMLARTRAELQAIYDHAPVMMCVLDSGRRMLYANVAFTTIVGVSENHLKGERIGGAFGCINALDDPRGCGFGTNCRNCALRLAIEDTFTTGIGRRDVERHIISVCDGVPREVSLLGSTAIIHAADQNCLLLCLYDISERKRAEDSLRASEEKYRLIVETSVEGIWFVDAEYRTIYVNRHMTTLLGYSADEMLGHCMAEFLFEEDIQDHQAHIWERTQGIHGRYERRWRRKDGMECWTVVSATSLCDADGQFAGVFGMLADITAHKKDEDRLAALEMQLTNASRLATLGELAAGIAHELNQPLCAIVNYAKACKNVSAHATVAQPQIGEWSEAIAVTAARCGDIIRGMLGLALGHRPKREMVAIRQLVTDAMSLVRHEAQMRKVGLRQEIPNQDLMVYVASVQIHQVLVNLLRNAIEAFGDASPTDAQVVMQARLVDGLVHISVSDNASTLLDAERIRIFEPFFTTKQQGLGLGLSISKTIVEDHGGRIWATIRRNGGLTIDFTLPAEKDRLQDVPE